MSKDGSGFQFSRPREPRVYGVIAVIIDNERKRSLVVRRDEGPRWQYNNYNFGHGWYFYSDPNITANWQAKGTKWTVPLGGGGGRIIRIGKLPIKLPAGLFYNVVQPTYGGRWVLNSDLTLI